MIISKLLCITVFIFVFICDLNYELNDSWYPLLVFILALIAGFNPLASIVEVIRAFRSKQ